MLYNSQNRSLFGLIFLGDGHKTTIPIEFDWTVSDNPKPGYEYVRANTFDEL